MDTKFDACQPESSDRGRYTEVNSSTDISSMIGDQTWYLMPIPHRNMAECHSLAAKHLMGKINISTSW